MSSSEVSKVKGEEEAAISLDEFLESIPPSSATHITEICSLVSTTDRHGYYILTPEIQLHCPENSCNGTRFFRCIEDDSTPLDFKSYIFFYLVYVCSNCQRTRKTYSLAAKKAQKGNSGICYKFGELPQYGPPTPSRLIKLLGEDREIFLKGRRCENQGLGIGAFVYYRRVVENQKARILGEILKVARKLSVEPRTVETLETAIAEVQFSKAIASVKDSIPQALLINGHNPLTLLHSALSDGLHEKSDEDCLELASSIRIVLGELSERLAQALKDEAELNTALSRLMRIKQQDL